MGRSIVNRRNAVIGWVTWNVGKRVMRKKARKAVPSVEGGRPNTSAIAAAVASLAGALMFWRKLRKSSESTDVA